MTVEAYALGCVLASALLKIFQRTTMLQEANRSSVLIWYNVFGGLLLLPFIPFEALTQIPLYAWLMLFTAAMMWLVCDSLHLESMRYLSASDNEIISILRVVLIAIIGIWLFQDVLSTTATLGMLIVICSMLYNLDLSSLQKNRGTTLAIAGAGFAAIAVSIDKLLLELINPQIVVFCAFVIPGSLLVARNRSDAWQVSSTLRAIGIPLLIAPLLGVIRYFCMIHAYSLGQLSVVTMILQATVFVVFLLEVSLFRNRRPALKNGISSFGCATGAILIGIS